MQILKIAVTVGRKVNLGNYESATFDIMMEAALDAADDVAEVRAELWATARAELDAQLGDIPGHTPRPSFSPVPAPQPAPVERPATDGQRRYISDLLAKLDWDSEDLDEVAQRKNVRLEPLTAAGASLLIDSLKAHLEAPALKPSQPAAPAEPLPADSEDLPF